MLEQSICITNIWLTWKWGQKGRAWWLLSKRKIMPTHCCIPLLLKKGYLIEDGMKRSYFIFPSCNLQMKKKWLQTIRRGERKHFKVTKHTKVCSLHFRKSDIVTDEHSVCVCATQWVLMGVCTGVCRESTQYYKKCQIKHTSPLCERYCAVPWNNCVLCWRMVASFVEKNTEGYLLKY